MNSSTLTSNYKRLFYLLIALTFILYFVINYLAYAIDEKLRIYGESVGYYSGFAKGKIAMLSKMHKDARPDIIFVGNSQTESAIDTSLFYSNGIRVINYSFAGYFLAQYPGMVMNAVALKPRIIAIPVSLFDLYSTAEYVNGHYNFDYDLTTEGLEFLIKNTRDLNQLQMTSWIAWQYLKNSNYFIEKGFQIRQNLEDLYDKKARFYRVLFAKYSPEAHIYPIYRPDCPLKPDGKYEGGKCYNADTTYIGQYISDYFQDYQKVKEFPEKEYNYSLVGLFNQLFDYIRSQNITPVLVVLPSFYKPILDEQLLKLTIHAEVINLASYKLPSDFYHDPAHINYQGRHAYSKTLIQRFRPLVLEKRKEVA